MKLELISHFSSAGYETLFRSPGGNLSFPDGMERAWKSQIQGFYSPAVRSLKRGSALISRGNKTQLPGGASAKGFIKQPEEMGELWFPIRGKESEENPTFPSCWRHNHQPNKDSDTKTP